MAIALQNFQSGELPVLRVALAAWDAGLCVVPPNGPGNEEPKSPLFEYVDGRPTWKHFQSERPDRAKVERWYAEDRTWIGTVCGAVSGGLELFEFDNRETYKSFVEAARACGLNGLVERIEAGYCEDTPGGGVHWFYYSDEVRGNTKLARRDTGRPVLDPKTGEPVVHKGTGKPLTEIEVLIETRGEGGFAVISPTTGLHANGRSYTLRSGGVALIGTLTTPERDSLWDLARTFDEMSSPDVGPDRGVKAKGVDPHEVLPGEDFNVRSTWDEILKGWTKLHTTSAGVTYWRRPGKDRGWSATTNYKGNDRLNVYSSSTEFDPVLDARKTYDRFGAYAALHHRGDLKAAVRDLAVSGYGTYWDEEAQQYRQNPKPKPRERVGVNGQASILPEESSLALRRLMDIQPTPIRWLCRKMLPLGKLIILAGEGGLGKSTVTLHLSACLTLGIPPFGLQDGFEETASIILIACEDDVADTTVPRLLAAGADLSRIYQVEGIRGREGKLTPFSLLHFALLERALESMPDCRLVVIDPVGAFVGRSGVNDHKNAELTALLGPLSELAARQSVTILLVAHLNKGVTPRAAHRVMGSVAYVNTARAAFIVARDQETPERRILAPLKFNLGPEPKALAYKLRSLNPEELGAVLDRPEFAVLPIDQRLAIGEQLAKVEWMGEVETTADECFAAEKQVGREPAELNKAIALLREVVGIAPIRAPDVFRAAEARDISEKTLKRAKAKEGILSYQIEGQRGWWWSYPRNELEDQGAIGPEYQNPIRPEHQNHGPLPDPDQWDTDPPF